MTAHIARFSSRAAMLRRGQDALLRKMLLDWEDEAPQAVRQLLALIDRRTVAERG